MKSKVVLSFKVLVLTIMLLSSTSIFSQETKKDCRVLLSSISKYYEGDCKNGLAHGKGVASGIDHYEGKFKNGLPDGTGTYTWKNGNVYTGGWKKGKRHGKGTLFSAANNGEVTGIWKEDKFIKEVKIPEYRVVQQYNVQKVTVRRLSEEGNKVTIKLTRDGKIRSDQESLNIESTGGVLSKATYNIYTQVVFPWSCTVTFYSRTRLSRQPLRCKAIVDIDKPGEWEIMVYY